MPECHPHLVPNPANTRMADLRLRQHADFQRVYRNSRKQYARELSFFFVLREDVQGPRFGLTVGKVLGKAHDRNRIKRRLREAIRLHAHLLHDLSVDVVLHPRKSVLELPWEILHAEILGVLRNVRRLALKGTTARQGASAAQTV